MTKKVAVCIPSGDMVHADFAMALAAMMYRCGPFEANGQQYEAIPIGLINTKGSLVVNNRNKLVEQARELGVDYLFFVDSDIVLHVHTLRRLLGHEKDIVGATYIQREEPHRLLGKSVDGELLHEYLPGKPIDTNALMEVGALPGGCLLINMKVFDAMEEPIFQTPAHVTDGTPWIEGEDYFFCRNARALNFSIWLDWGVSCSLRHIGQTHNEIPTHEPETQSAIVH
jgi:hypothetical protein